MVALRGQVTEFVRKPVQPIELEVSLLRIRQLFELRERCSRSEERSRILSGKRLSAFIKKERFTFIKQIADSLSAFMGRIATDAQDGLRYFDEMPYFMAIHSAGCRVLSTNSTFTAHLGDRVNQNSWDIYAGAHATPETCPVAIPQERYRQTGYQRLDALQPLLHPPCLNVVVAVQMLFQ